MKEYFQRNLLLEDNLINKLCICDTTNNKVWSNITSKEIYFQECLNDCPEGYSPEEITNQCIEKIEISTTQIEISTTQIEIPTTQLEIPTTQIEILSTQIEIPTTQIKISTTQIEIPTTQMKISKTQIIEITQIEIDTTEKVIPEKIELTYPEEYYKDPSSCPTVYNKKCYEKILN